MYPEPIKISGKKKELINSYIKQVNKPNLSIPFKNLNEFRICSYNVKYFDFTDNTNKQIKNFIDKIDPDAFSLIEYSRDNDKYFIDKYNEFFEQMKNYGIYSFGKDVKESICINSTSLLKDCPDYSLDEERGFTFMKCKFNGIFINIITIHLDVSDDSALTRSKEIQDVVNFIIGKNLQNTIIIGDFNDYFVDKNNIRFNEHLEEFKERTGLDSFPNKVHSLLEKNNFTNIYQSFINIPKFSCWSGKLVDFCYIYNKTWDSRLVVKNFYMPFLNYSDHLPLVIDIIYK